MESLEITSIDIPFPQVSDLELKLALGACKLRVTPGQDEPWVAGSYQHPIGTIPLKIEEKGGTVRISQEYGYLQGIGRLTDIVPTFDLALGRRMPYKLSLEGGASDSRFDLGGLPLRGLTARQGAGKVEIDFSEPNPEPMALLDLEAGAVALEMSNLANVNCAEMVISGGAASFKLDFGGTLQRETEVRITAGMATVEIVLPSSTAARVISEPTVATGLKVGDGFTTREGAFWTSVAMAGNTPTLTIRAKVTLGSLQLNTI